MRFRVYIHRIVRVDNAGNDVLKEIPLIFLESESDIHPTDFHKYVGSGGMKKVGSHSKASFYNVTAFLNYVYFEKNYIACMNELTVEMVQEFLTSYGIKCEKKKSTVDRCMDDVMVFLVNYKRSNKDFPISQDNLFFTKKVRTRNNRTQTVKIPKFRIEYEDSNGIIFRDMPQKAFEIIYANIFNNHKRILMAVALQAFAGLRPSEALNVRRTDSVLGAGLMFEMVNGIITDVSIDLNKEYNLRSDLMKVGGIKKERTQKVFIDFLPEFIKAYNEYMDYMKGKPYESAFGALTVNKQGKAMTYPTYAKEFSEAVKEVIPVFLSSDDPDLVLYGQILQTKTVAPHILRHYFTTRLVCDYNLDIPDIMYWRGDKSPESALTYLQNKSDLNRALKGKINERFKDAGTSRICE